MLDGDEMSEKKEVLLKAEHMYKEFGATKAVTDVSLTIYAGQIRGLIGENGSGKSTLASMITGALKPDKGEMMLNGVSYAPKSLRDSMDHGVGIVVQETGVINSLTIAENIFMGRENLFGKYGLVNMSALIEESRKALQAIGATHIDPEKRAEEYSFEDRKLVEIAASLYQKPNLLIVDETTTALSQNGREKIYEIMNQLRNSGKAILFISHDLDELQRVCDTVDVLRDGSYIGTLEKEDITPQNMRQMMIGRELSGHFYRPESEPCSYQDDIVLEAKNICYHNVLKDVALTLHAGKILGIGGLSDCGVHELCKILFGAIVPEKGVVRREPSGRIISSPSVATEEKIAYIPKDRDQESVLLGSSIKDNICLTSMDKLRKGFYIGKKKEKVLADEIGSEFSIKMREIEQMVSELSGGNKQKVAFGKWIANDSQVFIMDCPTRGIDVGVKKSIYELMSQLKSEGKSIIMVSEELPELIGMTDRCIILKDGMVSGEFIRGQGFTESALIQAII